MVLKGQVTLVTGAAQGIGAAIVLELARMGATVIGTDINEDGANRISAALAAVGAQGRGLVTDVRDTAQVEAVIDMVDKEFGGVYVLVNNAGITRDNLAMRMKDEEWDMVIETNLKSVFRLSRAVMRGMMKARAGRIINLSAHLVAHDVEEQRMVGREDHLDRGGLAFSVPSRGRPTEELGQVASD